MTWCQTRLQNWGLQDLELQDICSNGIWAHRTAYLALRQDISQHIASQQEPQLLECEKPLQDQFQPEMQETVINLENRFN